MDGVSQRVTVATQVIREAADLALSFAAQRDALTIESKGPQDLVSRADREVEDLIRSRLMTAFPSDAFVGEETGSSVGLRDDVEGSWVVDPIDGTQPFLLGLPFWSISIAYVRDGRVEIGLVMNPSTGDLYAAQRGRGVTVNGVPTEVRDATSLDQGVVGVGCSMKTRPEDLALIMERLLRQQGMFLRIGSGALNLAYVAAGQLIGYVEMHINGWDCLAALCLCQEAGATCSDFISMHGIAGAGPLVVGAPGIYSHLTKLLPDGTLDS